MNMMQSPLLLRNTTAIGKGDDDRSTNPDKYPRRETKTGGTGHKVGNIRYGMIAL